MADGRILIAGTGRAGTSFLMRLLTRLGYDTGFTPERDGYEPAIRAGAETWCGQWDEEFWDSLPRIVKSPYLSLATNFARIPVPVAHVFCPVRNLEEVAASREAVDLPWKGVNPAEALGQLVATCMCRRIPLTLMRFPDSANRWRYCQQKLAEGLPDVMRRSGEFKKHFRDLQP